MDVKSYKVKQKIYKDRKRQTNILYSDSKDIETETFEYWHHSNWKKCMKIGPSAQELCVDIQRKRKAWKNCICISHFVVCWLKIWKYSKIKFIVLKYINYFKHEYKIMQ